MILFSRDIVEIYKEILDGSKCGYDHYDQPRKCMILSNIVQGNLQPLSPNESRQIFGTILQDNYRLYLEENVKIENNYKIRIKSIEGCFKVIGTPKQYKKIIPHIEVLLTRDDEN